MGITFYYHPYSTAAITLWELAELGIPHERVKLDLSEKRDQRKPEYLALNPNGKVPLVVHDGTPIFESAAITIYLGEQFGVAKDVWPAAGPRRGEAMKWVVWTNVTLAEAFSRWWRNTSDRVPVEQHNAATAAAAKQETIELLAILDQALAGKAWLVGDQFSLADLHVVSFLDYFRMCGQDLSPYANLVAWVKRAESRPSHDAYLAIAKS
jgi:glutathione S-transferase